MAPVVDHVKMSQESDKIKKLVVLKKKSDHVIIAQWLARQLATGEVPGSNPSKGDDLINS